MMGRGSRRAARKEEGHPSSSQEDTSSDGCARSTNARAATKPLRSSARIRRTDESKSDQAATTSSDGLELPLSSSQDERNLRSLEERVRAKLEVPEGMLPDSQPSAKPLSQRCSQRETKQVRYEESDAEDGDENDRSFDDFLSKEIRRAKMECDDGKLFVPTFITKKADKSLKDVSDRSMQLMSEINAHYHSSKRSSQAANNVPERASKRMKHCPFCKDLLPNKWYNHKDLRKLMQEWLDRYHDAQGDLGATATITLCTLHNDLRDVIPEGIKRKWPKSLDVDELKGSILSNPSFLRQMRARIERPKTSDWFESVLTQRKEYGKKYDGGVFRMSGLDDMHAGYYGELGYEAMHNMLVEQFMDDKSNATHNLVRQANQSMCPFAPLSAPDFLLRVLLPELICMVIQDTEQRRTKTTVTLTEAKAIRDASQRYGVAMFPIPDAIGEEDDDEDESHDEEEEEEEEPGVGRISWRKYSDYDEHELEDSLDKAYMQLKAGKTDEVFRETRNNLSEAIIISSSSSSQSTKRKRGKGTSEPPSESDPPTQSPSRPRPRPSLGDKRRPFVEDAQITAWINVPPNNQVR